MNTNVFRLLLLGSLFSLSACVQQSEVRQMKHSVSTLNQEMTQLNKETVKITQQNRLNAKSSSGVYLLPGAKTPARLESQIGTLRMSLVNITPDTDGTTLTLRIQGESNDPLPAFSGTVEYGQIQGTIDNFQEINVQNQLINAPASVLAPSDVDIPLQLKGMSVDQLGFVRIHDIQPGIQYTYCGAIVCVPQHLPRHFVTPLTSPGLIVKVCNKGESQYNPRPNVCKRERNRLRK